MCGKRKKLYTKLSSDPSTKLNKLWYLCGKCRLFRQSKVFSKLASDLRIAYATVAVYTTLVSHISSTAAVEAEKDVANGKNFTVNANWTNELISGGVSDPVLWGCRHYSDTKHYYRSLYGVLLCSYLIAVIGYMLIRVVASCLSLNAYRKLESELVNEKDKMDGRKQSDGKDYVLDMAHSLKLTLDIEYILENPDDGVIKEDDLQGILKHWEERSASPRSHMWVFFVFYFIPMLDTVLTLLVVIAIILSYDLHPIVCLSGMFKSEVVSITYNPVEYSVVLSFPNWAKVFQKSILTSSVGVFVIFTVFQMAVEEHI